MEMAIHNSGGGNVLYVAVVNAVPMSTDNQLAAIFWTTNQGSSWMAMDLPQTDEGGTAVGIHSGGQGNKHLSIAAHPTDPNILFIGGDRQPPKNDAFPNSIGATTSSGRLFRGDRSETANGDVESPQWTPITNDFTMSGSSPHADSRSMTFINNMGVISLIEADDGGLYQRTDPLTDDGDWFSLSGTLQISEVYSVAYDSNSHTIFAGAQDNGTSRQDGGAGSNTVWRGFKGGDGGDVDVDTFTLDSANRSIRYGSAQNLQTFERVVFDSNNGFVERAPLFPLDGMNKQILPVGFTADFVTPVEVNKVRPTAAQLTGGQSTRVVIGANTVFEANDAGVAVGGAAWTQIMTDPGFSGVNRAAVSYGGYKKGLAILGATNAATIVITSNAHGLSTGDQVEISGVLGNTAANGSFQITVVDENTFQLNGVSGNGNYISGGTWRQANPEILYVGSDRRVWVRDTAGGNLTQGGPIMTAAGATAAIIRDVVVDPDDWNIVFAVDELGHVFKSVDTGASWTDITGNLLTMLESATRARSGVDANLWAAEVLHDIILPGSRTAQNVLTVGGAFGVFFQTGETDPSGGEIWRELGTGMPNVVVVDLDQGVDEDGNAILVASTLGRGVFSMTFPQTLGVSELVDLLGPAGLNISITGATIITHGFEPFDADGDSMLPLAQEIRNVADAGNGADKAWLLDFDARTGRFDAVDSVLPTAADAGASGEIVLMFDWTEGSQHISPGWTEAAGDALFGMITQLRLVDPPSGDGVDLHFIGYGTGAVVTSEAVERLAYFNVPVEQLTYLDPHDFDQGLVLDGSQRLDEQAQPESYGAAVWSNVEFADVYYQTRGTNGSSISDVIVMDGRPIPGAANFFIDASNFLPSTSYDAMNVFGDHRYIWEGFYLSTVNGSTPQANETAGLTEDTPAPATAIPTNNIGYAFSRIKNTATRPDPTFYENPDRGLWADGVLYNEFDRVQFGGNDFVALRTHTAHATGVGEPEANGPGNTTFWLPVAGPFPDQDHTHSPSYIVDTTTGAPNMAGLLEERLSVDLVTNARQRPHWNPLEIVNGGFDQVGDLIGFDHRRLPGWSDFSSSPLFDPVDVALDVALQTVTLSGDQPGLTHNWVYVPAEAERLAVDIQVTRFSGNDTFEVLLGDTVLVEEAPTTDDLDITFIGSELETHRYVIPSSLKNKVLDLTVRLNDGGDNAFNAEVMIDNIRFEGYLFEVLAGDVTLIDLGAVVGGSSFSLLDPLVHDAGQVLKAASIDPSEPLSFANSGRLYFIPDFNTDGVTITFDDDDATAGNDDFATIRFQADFGAGLEEKIAHVRVIDGYSTTGDNSVILTGSVGSSGVNKTREVFEVQQRLRYFNARGKNNAEVVADGVNGTITQDAIRIFQAQTQEDGLGNPEVTTFFVDGRVDVGFRTIRWLNSPDAPYWAEVREPLTNRIDFEDESFAASWTRETIETAVSQRPELKRIGDFEEFGVNNLSEFPDNGPTTHTAPSNKGGNTIDWEIEQNTLIAGTGSDPIDFSVPFDLDQPAITQAERDVVLDVMAFVVAAKAVGSQVDRVNIGGTGGQPSYQRVRQILTALGAPNVSAASGRDEFFTIHLLPPNGELIIPQGVQEGLLMVLNSLRDNGSLAVLSQSLMQTVLPLVDMTIAESIDLESAIDMAIVQPVMDLFNTDSAPHIHTLQNVLEGLVVQQGDLRVELHNVHVDVDSSGAQDKFLLRFDLRALQLNDVDLGGDLPQNSGGGPQDILDPTAAATNFSVDLRFPLEIRVPLDFNPVADPESDIMITPGDVIVDVASINIRDFDASIGVMPIEVHHDPVAMTGQVIVSFDELGEDGQLTLEQLNDPFLGDAMTTVPVSSMLEGVLPLQHTFCSFLTPGADPLLTISSLDIFNGLPADVIPNGDFSPLMVFESLSNVDVYSMLNSLSTTLDRLTALTEAGDGLLQNIPFVGQSLTSLIDVGSMITDMVDDLSNGVDIYFENFQQLVERLQVALGATAEELNVRCDEATSSVLLDLNLQREFDLTVPLDFGANLGPIAVAADFEASFTPSSMRRSPSASTSTPATSRPRSSSPPHWPI